MTTQALTALPKVGPQRAGRLLSAWIAAQPAFEVATLVVPAGLDARIAGRAVDQLGPPAPRLLRDDPWRLLSIIGVTPPEADRVARAALPGVARDDPRRSRALTCGEPQYLDRARKVSATIQNYEVRRLVLT